MFLDVGNMLRIARLINLIPATYAGNLAIIMSACETPITPITSVSQSGIIGVVWVGVGQHSQTYP